MQRINFNETGFAEDRRQFGPSFGGKTRENIEKLAKNNNLSFSKVIEKIVLNYFSEFPEN